MTLLLRRALMALFIPVSFVACKKDHSDSNACANKACTADFGTIQVCLRNANAPFTVDSVLTLLADGTRVSVNGTGALPAPGCYGVLNDNWVQGHQNTQTTMRFQAFRNGQVVVDTPYVIGADWCHISRISGPTEIAAR